MESKRDWRFYYISFGIRNPVLFMDKSPYNINSDYTNQVFM